MLSLLGRRISRVGVRAVAAGLRRFSAEQVETKQDLSPEDLKLEEEILQFEKEWEAVARDKMKE